VLIPKVLASSNLGLKLANAFGVFFKLNQYDKRPKVCTQKKPLLESAFVT